MRIGTSFIAALLLVACGSSATPTEEAPASAPVADDGPAHDPTQLLAVGSVAPDFIAPDETGADRSLAGFRGNTVVLYFYPRDATPGCTVEACAFRDAWDRYASQGITVLGVSVDDVASHRAFQQEHELPFPLLADTDHAITDAYGARATSGDTIYSRRVTYVIGPDGVITHVFGDVDPGVHADEVLGAIGGAE